MCNLELTSDAVGRRPGEARASLLDVGSKTPIFGWSLATGSRFRRDDATMQQQWMWAEGKAEAHEVFMTKALLDQGKAYPTSASAAFRLPTRRTGRSPISPAS